MQRANGVALIIAVAAISCLFVPSFGQKCPPGMTCIDAADESNGVHYLLIGNPGTGKSTILNGFSGKALFQSGISFSGGKTQVMQREQIGKNVMMDTPGLDDVDLRKQAAEEITKALKEGGVYKIFFVITLEEGRVKPADRTTMDLVLRSAPIGRYGVIVNKVDTRVKKMLDENKGDKGEPARDLVIAGINNKLTVQSLYFFFNERDPNLTSAENKVMPITKELGAFIQNVPAIEIRADQVQKIQEEKYEAIREQMEKVLKELREDNEKLRKVMSENEANFKSMLDDAMKRNDDLQKKFDELQNQKQSGGGDPWSGIAGIIGAIAPVATGLIAALR